MTIEIGGRIWNHKHNIIEGFTKRCGVHILVWYEAHNDANAAEKSGSRNGTARGKSG